MKLAEFFQDSSGQLSSNRLVWVVFGFCFCVSWTYLSIKNGNLQSVDYSIAVIFGILTAGKVGQKFAENGADSGGTRK